MPDLNDKLAAAANSEVPFVPRRFGALEDPKRLKISEIIP